MFRYLFIRQRVLQQPLQSMMGSRFRLTHLAGLQVVLDVRRIRRR
jgi:hypothetical protein